MDVSKGHYSYIGKYKDGQMFYFYVDKETGEMFDASGKPLKELPEKAEVEFVDSLAEETPKEVEKPKKSPGRPKKK